MAKITRYDGDYPAFAQGADLTSRLVFGGGTNSDELDDNINSEFLDGWDSGLSTEGKPFKQYFNALGFTLSQTLAYLHQMGVSEWNTSQEYHSDSVVIGSDGILYQSEIDSNTGNDPSSDITNWRYAASEYVDSVLSAHSGIASTTSVAGHVELATNTETRTGTDATRAVTPDGLTYAFEDQSLASNGYQMLPGGLILQWGSFDPGALSNNATGTQTFPITFPSECYQVIVGSTGGAAGGSASSEGFNVTASSAASFDWLSSWNSLAGSTAAWGIRYFAVGR